MNPIDRVKSWLGVDLRGGYTNPTGQPEAGTGQLPSAPPVKVPSKSVALPGYKKEIAKSANALARKDMQLMSTDVTTFRNGVSDTRKVIKELAVGNPDLASTINAYLRVGIPEQYTILARDMDGQINPKATQLAQELLRRLTFLGDPTLGYNPYTDLQSVSESLGLELLLYGAMSLELALDSAKIPAYFQPVTVTSLKFKEDSKTGVYPYQELEGKEFPLDHPLFFYLSVDQDLLSAYSTGYLDSSIQAVLADSKFLNDVRMSLQRAIVPRTVARIIEEKVKAGVPPEILNDPEKLATLYNGLIEGLQDTLTNLEPEDALVSFDSVEWDTLNNGSGNSSAADTLRIVQDLLNSKLAAGAKTLPSILGRDTGGTAAATSSMLFVKSANIIRTKLNTIYSRAMTQAVRLMGEDVYVEFKYADIDLRPKSELEAYRAMEMSRITDLLSLGFLTDEEASIMLTGNLPPAGHKPLSGTMFKAGKSAIIENPTSQTGVMGKDKPTQPKD